MIFQAVKKSTALPSLQGKLTRAHGTLSRPISRHFISPNALGSSAKQRSYVTESLSLLPSRPYGTTTAVATTARFPPGNPSTMAFLGVRSKSSGAAFRAQYDEDEDDALIASAVGDGMRVEERSVQEAWMVNLNRGDEEWLTGPRGVEWFTGLAPGVCPGEFHLGKCLVFVP
jgi:hypothetical protein